MVKNTLHANWSAELKDLQDETTRLLRFIRADSGSQKQHLSRRHVFRREGKAHVEAVLGTDSKVPHRRRKRRQILETIDASAEAETADLEASGSREFSYTLDTSRWSVRGTPLQTSEMGIGKATIEVLDRGKDTPRPTSPFLPEAAAPAQRSCGGRKAMPEVSQTANIAATDEDEIRFRSLAFKSEEFRVRGSADTYVPSSGGLSEELRRLKAERHRLASIEEAQRETCRERKRQEFLRFARRKWLASDRAAESVQRVFRGYVGRKRARLTAEVWRLTGKAHAEWVEVRDHNRGETWYYNPTSGKSQWDRPVSLLGTMTPSEKIRTLPALESPLTGPKDHKLTCEDEEGGFASKANVVTSKIDRVGSDFLTSFAEPTDLGEGSGGVGAAAAASKMATTVEESFCRGVSAQTAHVLPPLMMGTRYSTPSNESHATGLAPYSTTGGSFTRVDGRGGHCTARQQACAEQDEGGREDEEEEFPFLIGNRILPDDRFEETGLGLARRTEEDEAECSWNSHGSRDNSESTQGFFLADGTPNIRLRRTIAKALRVTKFDSVSTLLADYTGRHTATRATTAVASAAISMPSSDLKPAPRHMVSTAPAIGSRTYMKRGRNQTARVATGSLDDTAPYPTGKLEQDKSFPLFNSSIVGGGRRMVSVMTGAGRKAARAVKTAGKRRTRDRGGVSNKGLAIRDLPPPGFERPPGGANLGTTYASVDGEGDGHQRSDKEAHDNLFRRGDRTENGVETQDQEVKEICFNCWSKGSGKTCTLHTAAVSRGSRGRVGGKAGEVRAAESALMCKNWDIGVMRRRYRSEELQEVFAKETSSIKYDKERKKFISIVGQRHPIYRQLAKTIDGYNFTARRKLHQRNWWRAFVEQLRMGKLPGIPGKDVHRSAKILRLRNTLHNSAKIKAYTSTVKSTQPQPPITGSTLAERLGLVRVIVDRPSAVTGRVTRLVLDGPTPVPQGLCEARRYHLPPAKTIPMAEPNYLEGDDSDEGRTNFGGVFVDGDRDKTHRAGWMLKFCEAAAGDIVHAAVTNVEVMSPVPGADDMSRTKHPPPRTIKFVTFSRKPTPGMMAMGGLPAEMVVHMLVCTRIPPQYGNFTVMQKSSAAPTASPEVSAAYESLEAVVENQSFLPRPLQHPLNGRKAPSVMTKTFMTDPENRHYFGLNRPEQTGEADSHGFRTSSHADATPTLQTLDPTAFLPSEDVVTSNRCSANRTVMTHVDRSYPFCEPSNRSNTTTLDFYHLLLTATCSPNKEQVFTNLGVQECGDFMRGSDPLRPMGHCVGMIYRSWAFLQKQALEEFETDDGIPYWFDQRTGETFWERPLRDEEKVPVKQGGTVLGGRGEPPDSSCGAFEEVKPRYDQQQMRKLMMKSHENEEHLDKRRKQVATQVKCARSSGALPSPNPNDLEPPKQEPDADERLEPEGDGLAEERASDESSIQSTKRRHSDSRNFLGTNSRNVSGDGLGDEGHGGYDSGPQSGGGREGVRSKGHGKDGVDRFDQDAPGASCLTAERLVASLARALDATGLKDLNKGRQVNPSDMLRFGMGVGISLGASGLLGDLGNDPGRKTHEGDGQDRPKTPGANVGELSGAEEVPLGPLVVKISPNGHPIGHGYPEPIAQMEESTVLDHKGEEEHLASVVRDSTKLKTSEEFKGLLVVPHENPTPCPDEYHRLVTPEDQVADPRRKAELGTPIIAYPETLWKKQYRGHSAAGEGESWIPAGGDQASNRRAKSSLGVSMRRTNEPFPEGFLGGISHTHVANQNCDYLPHVPNMPQARVVGRVRPRSAAEDWFAVGFDPWSAGREPLSAEFVSTLSIKQEDLGGDGDGAQGGIVPQAGYLDLKAPTGHAEMSAVSEEAKMAKDFDQLTSWARHGHYSEIEAAMSQADWTMPIDYQNEFGLTLLHVAAQNDNKRIAKLCLRKGADVNKRKNNGQTPLHYAYSYGYKSFGEYLISKGADDSITNADGLTCYEGLSQANLENL